MYVCVKFFFSILIIDESRSRYHLYSILTLWFAFNQENILRHRRPNNHDDNDDDEYDKKDHSQIYSNLLQVHSIFSLILALYSQVDSMKPSLLLFLIIKHFCRYPYPYNVLGMVNAFVFLISFTLQRYAHQSLNLFIFNIMYRVHQKQWVEARHLYEAKYTRRCQ